MYRKSICKRQKVDLREVHLVSLKWNANIQKVFFHLRSIYEFNLHTLAVCVPMRSNQFCQVALSCYNEMCDGVCGVEWTWPPQIFSLKSILDNNKETETGGHNEGAEQPRHSHTTSNHKHRLLIQLSLYHRGIMLMKQLMITCDIVDCSIHLIKRHFYLRA